MKTADGSSHKYIMRYYEIINETFTIGDYASLGLDATKAKPFMDAGFSPKIAKMYIDEKLTVDDAISDRESGERRRAKEEAEQNMLDNIKQIASKNTPITHAEACAIIAYDDDVFDDLLTWLNGDPDLYEDNPDKAEKMRAIIARIKPFKHPPLYRAESIYRASNHSRGFHSWTPDINAAKMHYSQNGGAGHAKLFNITVPAKAVEHGQIGYWRTRLHPNESHYLGSRAEWFVLDGQPMKEIKQ